MVKKQVIFVGWVNIGKTPVDGETTKNQYIIAELQKYCDLTILDFYNKKVHPWIYVQALWAFLTQPKATIIFSTTATNVYKLLKIFKVLRIKRHIIHWVVGGSFGQWILSKKLDPSVFKELDWNLVQCRSMIDELKDAGLDNAKYVSNFKPINYYPDVVINQKKATSAPQKPLRFVFVSRIMPDKGCDYILQAAAELNLQGYGDRFIVDFFGKIAPDYNSTFLSSIKSLPNISFHGLLDLKSQKGYDTLATYDAMLFPSYWRGEGFAGIFIDAFISGVPVLASDWAHNPESIKDGKLGILYSTHDIPALTQVMKDCIDGKYDLAAMSDYCRKEAPKYNATEVITPAYLKEIGLLDSKV